MIEVRLNKDSSLDEVVLERDGECLFHLEQLSDTNWWMAVHDGGQTVYINLTTRRATIRGHYREEGGEP